MTDARRYMERSRELMSAICRHARRTGTRTVRRDEVASNIGIYPPVRNLTKDAREFRETALVLKQAGYVTGPGNFEWVRLTDEGARACEQGAF